MTYPAKSKSPNLRNVAFVAVGRLMEYLLEKTQKEWSVAMTDRQTKDNEGQIGAFPCQFDTRLQYGLSQLDYACIHLKVPKTGKPWLDKLITESLRNEMAGRAMQGHLSNEMIDPDSALIPKWSYEVAATMLSTGKGDDETK